MGKFCTRYSGILIFFKNPVLILPGKILLKSSGLWKIFLTMMIAFVLSVQVSGQIKNAKSEMALFNYAKAVDILHQVLAKNDPKTKAEATLMLADCYRLQNDMQNAKIWYLRAIKLKKAEPITYLYYAKALRCTGDYQAAKKMFLHYDSLSPQDNRGKIYASFCDSAMTWEGNPYAFEVNNVKSLNSAKSDFGPVFYNNGVIFATDRIVSGEDNKKYGWTGNGYLQLVFSKPKNADDLFGDFTIPKPAPDLISGEYHDGPATFNKAGDEVFITRTVKAKDKGKKDPGRIRTHLLKIFTARKEGDKWSKMEPFFFNSNKYSVGHPALSPDGSSLYFVSDVDGGYGGTDIYITNRDGDKWNPPVNLGSKINTFGNEMFPVIADNGDLYFASDGHPGYGGLDIFVTRKENGDWLTPKNLGKPINSSYDDFALATYKTDSVGLFSSNRPGGKGSDDIYNFKLIGKAPQPGQPAQPVAAAKPAVKEENLPSNAKAFSLYVSGCVKDKNTLESIPAATIFMLDEGRGQVMVHKANNEGCFRTQVGKGILYTVKAMQTGYLSDCVPFSSDSLSNRTEVSLSRNLFLERLMSGNFHVDNIYYDFDKSFIRPDAEPTLNKLIQIMKANPVSVILGAHADCRGSFEYNIPLTKRRAESAVQYIVQRGIAPSRITPEWYGKTRLTNRCNCAEGVTCSEVEHQANRRTEFKIIGGGVNPAEPSFNPARFREGDTLELRIFPVDFFKNCSQQTTMTSVPEPARVLNSPGNKSPAQTAAPSTDENSNSVYTVQIGAYMNSYVRYKKVQGVMSCKGQDGIYRVFVGKFSSREEATSYRDQLRSGEFKDAFVAVMDDNHRLPKGNQVAMLSHK